MRKWSVVTGFCLLAGASSAADDIRIDGCAQLARVVYDEVRSSVLYGPAGAGPWPINPDQGEIHICRTATRTVSRAFSLAVQSVGLSIGWEDNPADSNYCPGTFLQRCHLEQRYRDWVPVWTTVSQAVMNEMYNPLSSDEVRFRSDDLRLRLGLSLRTIRQNRQRVVPGVNAIDTNVVGETGVERD